MIKMYFLPHLESFMWERKFEKKFFKKSPIQPPNGLFIFKLPFPNGSYRNGVWRALWARQDFLKNATKVSKMATCPENLRSPWLGILPDGFLDTRPQKTDWLTCTQFIHSDNSDLLAVTVTPNTSTSKQQPQSTLSAASTSLANKVAKQCYFLIVYPCTIVKL